MANEVDESEVEDDVDDDVTLSKAGRVLTSGGQNEAQAYATAQLRDAPQRPAIERERVRVLDPRQEKTVLTRLPKVTPPADLQLTPQSVGPEADDVTQDDVTRDEVTMHGAGPPPSAPVRSIAAPPMVASTKPPARSSSLGFTAAAIAAGVLLAVGIRFLVGSGSHADAPRTPAAPSPAATTVAAAPAPAQEEAPLPVAPVAPVEPVALDAPPATAPVDPPEPADPQQPPASVESAEPTAKPVAAPARGARRARPTPGATSPTPPPAPTQAAHRLFGVEN